MDISPSDETGNPVMGHGAAGSDDEADAFRWRWITASFVAVLLFGFVIGAIPWLTFHYRPEWAAAFPEEAGLWGDSFGFVNALMSALAFAGVLITLWMQRRELQLQREEMRLTREELAMTREEHSRTAQAQEGSENRLFLAAYMNALESLRQLSQWRMTADPATTKSATFPVVEGLVIQARVSESLQVLVRDLEPEIRRIHPAMGAVGESGSRTWRLERLLSSYVAIRRALETYRGRSDDSAAFADAVGAVRGQLEELAGLKSFLGPEWGEKIRSIELKAPDPKWLTKDISSDRVEDRQARAKYFRELERVNNDLLHLIMSMCHE